MGKIRELNQLGRHNVNNYKLLPALISILQTRNLTVSAHELNVTQSAMSKTLTQIRDAFHDKILIREGNQFVLTHKGELLKAELPVLMQSIDLLYAPDEMDLKQSRRCFTIASSDYVAQAVLPNITHEMHEKAPNVSLEFQPWQASKLYELAETQVDLVTTIVDDVPENLQGKWFAEDEQVVMLREDHPLLKKGEPLRLDEYCQSQHIVISGGGDKNSLLDQALMNQGYQRQVLIKVPFYQAAIELVLKTDALLTLPMHIAGDFAQRHPVSLRKLPIVLAPNQYYLLWHSKHHHDPEHKWFRELCTGYLQQHLIKTIEDGVKYIHTNK